MNKIFTFFLIILIQPAILYSWDSVAAKYYPLAVGNQWSFHRVNRTGPNCIQYTTESDYTISIVSYTLMPNGKWYYKFYGPTVNYTSYERIDSTTMNVYLYSSGSECIIDSLLARKDNFFRSCKQPPGLQLYQSQVLDTNTITFAGSPRKTKSIRGNLMLGHNYTLMHGIGLYRESACEGGSGALITLNGCIIDGVLYGQIPGVTFSISGTVRFQDNNQLVTSGYVKAFKHSSAGGNVILIDSVRIQTNGSYTFPQIPQDTIDLMAFDDDEISAPEFVPTYYPSTIEWQQAIPLYPASNLSNINIGVYRISNNLQNAGMISGKVYLNTDNPLYPLKDAIIYAKLGNVFKGYSVSSGTGAYTIDYLQQGLYHLVCSRMGYSTISIDQQLDQSNLENVNFYFGVPLGITNESIPVEYSLLQNYPNPFNPSTRITFSIPHTSKVKLYIFDVLGKVNKSLIDIELRPGTYNYFFNGMNLPSGVYFYRLEAGDYAETKKMVLLK